jgi:hemolysin D
MNGMTRKHHASAAATRRRGAILDHEFLPAALEILERPPSPVAMGLLLVICGLAASALAWAVVSRVDIVASARGKVQSVGHVKLVQPVETGKIREIFVHNGQHVHQGEVVLALDDQESRAEEKALDDAFVSLSAEVLRRDAAIRSARTDRLVLPVGWPDMIRPEIRTREERVLAGDLAQLRASLDTIHAQRVQKEAERLHLESVSASQEDLVGISEQRVRLRSLLEQQKLGTRLSLLDAQENLQQQRTALTQQRGQLSEVVAALAVLDREAEKALESFTAEQGQKLAEAQRQADDTLQRLIKARARSSHMQLVAPVSGIVQGLSVTSVGQVVAAGEPLLRIVPDDGGLEIEAYMPNQDIGFVRTAQDAIVKIDSFPFTRYGTLPARVTSVGQEPVAEPDAMQREVSPESAARTTNAGSAQRVQNLYFPVTLIPDRTALAPDGSLPISNGMTVTVEIKTGSRRVIDYLLSPLVETGSNALKER